MEGGGGNNKRRHGDNSDDYKIVIFPFSKKVESVIEKFIPNEPSKALTN